MFWVFIEILHQSHDQSFIQRVLWSDTGRPRGRLFIIQALLKKGWGGVGKSDKLTVSHVIMVPKDNDNNKYYYYQFI